jgi:hypothetical protein
VGVHRHFPVLFNVIDSAGACSNFASNPCVRVLARRYMAVFVVRVLANY